MKNVSALPRYNLKNVPEALRQLANLLEERVEGEKVVRCIVVLERVEGPVEYRAFGDEPFTRAHAAGLLLHAQLSVIGYSSAEEG